MFCLGVFHPTFPVKSLKPIFGNFRLSSTCIPFRLVFCHFQSLSVNVNQLQLILISFDQFDSVKNAGIYWQPEGGEKNAKFWHV